MGFQSASTFTKIALVLLLMAVFFSLLAIFSPYWLVYSGFAGDANIGLFYSCTGGTCSADRDTEPRDWQVAMFAVEVVGLLLSVTCVVFAVLGVFVSATSGRKWVKMLTISLAFGAGLSVLLGAVVCAAKKDELPELAPGFRVVFDLGWAFALAIVSGLLHLASAVCCLLDVLV